MHFTYLDTVEGDLAQGDILRRTPELDKVLGEVHPHYADRKNEFFQILTQSCDLVLRNGKTCTSRYVTVAPVRPARLALERYLAGYDSGILVGGHPLLNDRQRNNLTSFAQRLLNNNEAKYFYLEAQPSAGISEASCTYLSLSIALKSELQYQTLLDARILQLTENFRSKLGWMIGNLYSRVGTQDWESKNLQTAVKDRISDVEVLWLDPDKFKHLEKKLKKVLKECKENGRSLALDKNDLANHMNDYSSRRELVIARLDKILDSADDKSELMKKIRNDTLLSQHLK